MSKSLNGDLCGNQPVNAIEQTRPRGQRRVDGAGRPKFDFRTDSGLEQQVLGLEVAVHDAPVVQVRERVQQNPH